MWHNLVFLRRIHFFWLFDIADLFGQMNTRIGMNYGIQPHLTSEIENCSRAVSMTKNFARVDHFSYNIVPIHRAFCSRFKNSELLLLFHQIQ